MNDLLMEFLTGVSVIAGGYLILKYLNKKPEIEKTSDKSPRRIWPSYTDDRYMYFKTFSVTYKDIHRKRYYVQNALFDRMGNELEALFKKGIVVDTEIFFKEKYMPIRIVMDRFDRHFLSCTKSMLNAYSSLVKREGGEHNINPLFVGTKRGLLKLEYEPAISMNLIWQMNPQYIALHDRLSKEAFGLNPLMRKDLEDWKSKYELLIERLNNDSKINLEIENSDFIKDIARKVWNFILEVIYFLTTGSPTEE